MALVYCLWPQTHWKSMWHQITVIVPNHVFAAAEFLFCIVSNFNMSLTLTYSCMLGYFDVAISHLNFNKSWFEPATDVLCLQLSLFFVCERLVFCWWRKICSVPSAFNYFLYCCNLSLKQDQLTKGIQLLYTGIPQTHWFQNNPPTFVQGWDGWFPWIYKKIWSPEEKSALTASVICDAGSHGFPLAKIKNVAECKMESKMFCFSITF